MCAVRIKDCLSTASRCQVSRPHNTAHSPPAGVMRYVVITAGAVALIAHLLAQNVSQVQLDPGVGRCQWTVRNRETDRGGQCGNCHTRLKPATPTSIDNKRGRVSVKNRRLTCKRVHVMVLCHGHGHHGGQHSAGNQRHRCVVARGFLSNFAPVHAAVRRTRRRSVLFLSLYSFGTGPDAVVWGKLGGNPARLCLPRTSWLSGRGSPSLARC